MSAFYCVQDECGNEPEHTIHVLVFGEPMQTWICPEHMNDIRSTGVPVIDQTDRHGVYPVPDLPLCVVIVGGLPSEPGES